MSRSTFSQWAMKLVSRRRAKQNARKLNRTSTFERLGDRITPAVNAFFAGGQLTILGDAADNTIVVSRDAAGTLQVNGGAVQVRGGTPTVANTARMHVFGLGGNDALSLSESTGALPRANLFGGVGNDTLIGGSAADLLFGQAGDDLLLGNGGTDFLFGGAGNDTLTGGAADDQVFGEAGNDRMIWNPGDATDRNEGGVGIDTVEVNGGNGDEIFVVSANGTCVRFDRLITAPFSIDIGTSEALILNANGGDDRLTANGDLASLIALTLDGGAGNDGIFGGNGADVLLGGDGDDFIDGNQGADRVFLGAGNDSFQWDPGDGRDTVEGQAGFDTMQFNGSGADEAFDLSAVAGRVRLFRNVGDVVIDTNDLEQVNLAAFGGADQITVNDLSGADVTHIVVDLAGPSGFNGDAQNDTVTVFGTGGNDAVGIVGAGFNYAVVGLDTFVAVRDSEAIDSLVVNAMSGDDMVNATTLSAATARLTVDGGTGDDTLIGSQGNDTFIWSPGDGSDTVEGMAGRDSLIFNGSNDSENVRISANGNRVGLFRDLGTVRMDLNDVEQIDFNALGGADTIFVNDQSATDLTILNLNLKASTGVGDGLADAIIISGNDGDDALQIASFENGSRVAVATTSFPFINITGAEAANDRLIVNTLGGNDVVDAGSLAANAIALTLNGGAGNDELLAGGGNDFVSGGAGDDKIFLEAGNDTFIWNPGDGNDIVEGMAGRDTMIFNGNDTSEQIAISANGPRVRFARDIANVLMDLNGIERIDFNALGGADTVTVDDLTGTDVDEINLNLAAALGTNSPGDNQLDSIIIHGTAGNDLIPVLGNSGGILVNGDLLNGGGLAAFILIRGVEATDSLRINGGDGNDDITADGLETTVRFSADGGDGDDTLIGSLGDDLLLGGPGDDTLIGGPGLDVLDGGPGNNIVVQD